MLHPLLYNRAGIRLPERDRLRRRQRFLSETIKLEALGSKRYLGDAIMRKGTRCYLVGILLWAAAAPAADLREHGRTPRPPTPAAEMAAGGPVAGWQPALHTSWQWQLTTPVDQSVDVTMYDIDMFDNHASVVASLHAKGRKVVCYISAGTWENWRPDAGKFPSEVLGNSNGWAGERWLDIRRVDILGPLMEARLDLCRAKGFDGVEPDNVDGYSNSTGFPLTYQDQIAYNTFLAGIAHARGLSVGLKNDVEQAAELEPYFDWTLNEQCFQYKECTLLLPFVAVGKPVFEVEYRLETSRFCPTANAMNFNSIKKKRSLDAYRLPCR